MASESKAASDETKEAEDVKTEEGKAAEADDTSKGNDADGTHTIEVKVDDPSESTEQEAGANVPGTDTASPSEGGSSTDPAGSASDGTDGQGAASDGSTSETQPEGMVIDGGFEIEIPSGAGDAGM